MPSLLSFAHLLSLTLHKHKHLCYPFSEFRKRSVVSRYFSSFSFIIRLTQFLFAQTESIMISLEYITSPFLNNSKDALLPLGQMVWKSNMYHYIQIKYGKLYQLISIHCFAVTLPCCARPHRNKADWFSAKGFWILWSIIYFNFIATIISEEILFINIQL